jgi:hypothetical protein
MINVEDCKPEGPVAHRNLRVVGRVGVPFRFTHVLYASRSIVLESRAHHIYFSSAFKLKLQNLEYTRVLIRTFIGRHYRPVPTIFASVFKQSLFLQNRSE